MVRNVAVTLGCIVCGILAFLLEKFEESVVTRKIG